MFRIHKSKLKASVVGKVLGPVAFILVFLFFEPEDLGRDGVAVLAATLWMAIWWISEAVPISITALLPIVLFPLTGGLELEATAASYGHKYVFLYLGGFILAVAIERWGLHRRIALNIINFIGTDMAKIVLGFMAATAFMSMWISNTATSVMMLPIGMAIATQLKDNQEATPEQQVVFGKVLMLGIAYSASIGGIATLIGTPPNLVFAGALQEVFGIEISFYQWLKFGLPVSLTLLILCWLYLTQVAFKIKSMQFPGGRSHTRALIHNLGRMQYEEKVVLVIFVTTALLWISRDIIQHYWLPNLNDAIIAISAAISLFLFPNKDRTRKLLSWDEAVKIPWGIILLFGGGMSLAEAFSVSGVAAWLGNQMSFLDGFALFLLVLILIAAVNFMTEVTSNIATTALLLPVLAPIALRMDVHPFVLMVSATVAASCAFMLPVATPPNAVVFGSGHLRIRDMVVTGVWMNVLSIFLLTLFVYFLLPLVWGFDRFGGL